MKKSIISLVLTLCLAVGFAAMPITAHAASNGKAIQPGTACVADNDRLYFGKDSGAIQWLVLDADHTNGGSATGMFLLSREALGTTAFDDNSNAWQDSFAQAWCEENFDSIFTSAEKEAILSVSKEESDDPPNPRDWGASSLSSERLFFLSGREYKEITNPVLVNKEWWLRSPYPLYANHACFVDPDGTVLDGYVGSSLGARPAFNLDLNSVLFTSAAKDGKASFGAISEIPAYIDKGWHEWKVTLLDDSRSGFSAKATANKAGVLTVEYSGAVGGDNNYISAIIADSSGSYTHYGRLAAASVSGSVTVDISGIDMNGKTLYIFNEQYNGDKMTDLSSRLVEVEIPASISNPYGVPSTGSHRDTGLMLTLALLSGSVLFFSLRRKKEA